MPRSRKPSPTPPQRRARALRFVLRPGVVIDPRASLATAANALPDPDACAWFDRELAAAQAEEREPTGWLTLRETAAIMGYDFADTYYALRNGLDEQHNDPLSCVRRMGAWELVSAEDVARFIAWAKRGGWRRDSGAALSAALYAEELAKEHARREVDVALVDACSTQWAFSDGTRAGLGGFISGGSRFACELRRMLRRPIYVEHGPHPCGGREIEPTELEWFDLWLRQQSSYGYWLDPRLKLTKRPPNIPALPKVVWPSLPPGAVA